MKALNKSAFKRRKVVFMGQCTCPTNCTNCSSCINIPQKCEDTSIKVSDKIKDIYCKKQTV